MDVPYRGPVRHTCLELLGGLRSACTYMGARQLKEMPKRTTFVRVTQQLNPKYADNEYQPENNEQVYGTPGRPPLGSPGASGSGAGGAAGDAGGLPPPPPLNL